MKFEVTSSPHIRSKNNTQNIMLNVVIALIPTLAVGVVRFGVQALILTLVSVAAAVAAVRAAVGGRPGTPPSARRRLVPARR